jgi:hypothetical protein
MPSYGNISWPSCHCFLPFKGAAIFQYLLPVCYDQYLDSPEGSSDSCEGKGMTGGLPYFRDACHTGTGTERDGNGLRSASLTGSVRVQGNQGERNLTTQRKERSTRGFNLVHCSADYPIPLLFLTSNLFLWRKMQHGKRFLETQLRRSYDLLVP